MGKNILIDSNVVFVDSDHIITRIDVPINSQVIKSAPIYIDDDIWICANATIINGCHICKSAVVAANSVVRGDVPAYTTYGGC